MCTQHAQYVSLFLVLAVNFEQSQILLSYSYSSRHFYALLY